MKILEVIYANVPHLLHGALITLLLSAISVMLGIVVGLAVCSLQLSARPAFRHLGHAFVSVCRGLPLLVTILVIFYVPSALGVAIGEWPAAILALTLNTGAYQAEIYRAGYSMIPPSQIEAARILKLNRWQIRFYIVAPQLFRLVLPPLTNAAIDIVKSSSLVSVIAVTDLLRVSQQLVAQTYRPVEIYVTAAVLYVALTLMISGMGRLAEKRLGMGFGR
jgi:polar amino acid transport system permease protein